MPYISPALIVFLILLVLPIKLSSQTLKLLAFLIWVLGGTVLTYLGVVRVLQADASLFMILGWGFLALLIGAGKGKFVLSKTSARNIERLNGFTEPHKPIHVYSLRSWIIIGVMIGIATVLNMFPGVDLLVRGLVNLAIGFALITSSLAYLKALGHSQASV